MRTCSFFNFILSFGFIYHLVCFPSSLFSDDNFCHKCEVMKEYHAKNPSKYVYYEDYLRDLEEKGEEAVNPRFEDLPEEVQFIVDPKKKER